MDKEFYRFDFFTLSTMMIIILGVSIFLFTQEYPEVLNFLLAIIAFLFGISTILLGRIVQRTPATLSIGFLGYPSSGKTVFLTVLFDELGTKTFDNISFSPYGSETVEKYTQDLNLLTSGQWLPPTSPKGTFFYRAKAVREYGFFRKKFKIEIGDYAGEHIHEFDADDDMWLQKTDYFNYVIQSDAILIAIDVQRLIDGTDVEIREMENNLIAAIHILLEKKGVSAGSKLRAPVALTFMKYDLINDLASADQTKIMEKVIRLEKVCENRCQTFNIFNVSSVGHLNELGNPPTDLKPIGVVKPLLWILKNK
ncbi:MAG: hypothetical protein JW878_05645 [Methanomicrobia archaeon]|nr:hypothetical protein [Methanomicrobia archaeon]